MTLDASGTEFSVALSSIAGNRRIPSKFWPVAVGTLKTQFSIEQGKFGNKNGEVILFILFIYYTGSKGEPGSDGDRFG